MTRAEEAALKAYPVRTYRKDQGEPEYSSDYNANDRYRFQEGYEQAEKDLALTVEDIKQIILIHYDIVFKDETGVRCGDVAEEVLRRFKTMKEEQK